MEKITKYFDDYAVLDNVDFSAGQGQVHALIGENGAGKTTLMKILAGLYPPDKGSIFLGGRPVSIHHPKRAQELGISMIYQEVRLFPDLDVAENVFISREPLKKFKWFRKIDWDKAYKETESYLQDLGLDIDAHRQVKTLSIGQQRFIELIKAIAGQAKVIIMDEPTAALTDREIETLFRMISKMKKYGVTILYISHRLNEIKEIADKVSVIRNGTIIQTFDSSEIDMNKIAKVMVGKDVKDRYPKLRVKSGKVVLRADNLSYKDRIKNASFDLKEGEILGITGLSASGKRTLADVLFGINRPFEGHIELNGKRFKSMTPYLAKKNGLSYVFGIDTEEGFIGSMSIKENMTLTNLKRVSRGGFLNSRAETDRARDLCDRLELKENEREMVQHLSGGKQKKVIFAKWLFANSKIIMIDEPTAGIDLVSKIDIYNMINELVLSGASVMMFSTDFSEIMGMCDRIMVMYKGEIRKIFHREEASREKILYYASGGWD